MHFSPGQRSQAGLTSKLRRILNLDGALALLLFAASLALYVRTLAPGLLDGDEGEFQVNIFRPVKPPPASYTVFAHALDAGGFLRGQKDSLPRDGRLPTDRWLAGEVVADAYDITL